MNTITDKINPCENCITLAICVARASKIRHLTAITYSNTIMYLSTFCPLLMEYIDLIDHPDDNVCTYDSTAVCEAANALGLKPDYFDSSDAISLKQMQFIRGMICKVK